MDTLYDAAGGLDGLRRLAAAWHRRVLDDEIVGHAFEHGFEPDHTERLATYLAEALGGPPLYTSTYGDESQVVRIHSGNGPHVEMDERAIERFDEALTEVGWPTTEPLGRALLDYFAWMTHHVMDRYPDSADDVPDDLAMHNWTWDGPA